MYILCTNTKINHFSPILDPRGIWKCVSVPSASWTSPVAVIWVLFLSSRCFLLYKLGKHLLQNTVKYLSATHILEHSESFQGISYLNAYKVCRLLKKKKKNFFWLSDNLSLLQTLAQSRLTQGGRHHQLLEPWPYCLCILVFPTSPAVLIRKGL